MARGILHFVVFLLVLHVVKSTLEEGLEKRDLEDKWPVLSAILEKLFLPNECIFYSKLSSYKRSMDYSDPDASPLCDEKLESGWFRFTDSAGSQMATTCVAKDDFRCSAINPGWLDGKHPSIEDGRIERKVCFHVEDDCCHASVNIQVRNCGPFYVYNLVGVPCPFRYCGSHVKARATTASPIFTPQPETTTEPFPTEPENMTTAEPTTLPPFPTEPENMTTAEPTTLPPFPTEPENMTTVEPTTLPPFPTEPENMTTAEPTTLPPFPTEPENMTTVEPTTLPPFPTEPENMTTSEPTTLPPDQEDECSHYKTLVEPNRAVSFYDPFVVKGDHELQTDWYRFSEGAGTKMADKCVEVFHCGTDSPGWLPGGHPSNATNHAVWREVCFSWNDNCCYFKGRIQVRQCDDFFVYHLRKLRIKYLRYCGNGTITDKSVET